MAQSEELLESQEIEQDGTEMDQLRQATEEFVNLLSEISSKYGIESDDIDAMNAGLENVWNSVTMGEELPDEMEAAEELQLEMEELPLELEEEVDEEA